MGYSYKRILFNNKRIVISNVPIVEQGSQTFSHSKKKKEKKYRFIYVKFQKNVKLLYGFGSQVSGYPAEDSNWKGM